MTKRITRRQFMQAAGLGGATIAVSGCTINLQQHETLEPYVVPPEDALPGENIWYASACRQCPAGCGIIVRVSNGRPRKIEGNPQHPLNQGRLCARGQAGLQMLYDPDRLRNAVRNNARNVPAPAVDPFARGRGLNATAIRWEDALAQVAQRIQAAKPGSVAFYGNLIPDSLAAIVGPFLRALGATPPVLYDVSAALNGRNLLARAAGQLYGGAPGIPYFDLANADVVFSFGANFTESWLSPVAYGRAFGAMRGGSLGKRGYLVHFEPRLSSTGAMADEWLPCAPGTEGLVALALGRIIVDEGLGQAPTGVFASLFKTADVAGAAAASGITVEQLRKLARIFARFDRPLAIPGGALAGHTNASAAMTAVLALNALARDAGSPVYLTPAVPDPAFIAATPSSFAEVRALIERMRSGAVDVLFVYGNPLYDLPVQAGFAEALANVQFVVSFSSIVDETSLRADLILPDHTYLEGWGYQFVTPPADRPALTGQQPVVRPLYDTRATSDVFLDLAQRLGGAVRQALPWPNTVEFMKSLMAKLAGQDAPYATRNAETTWAGWRQVGGWWPTGEARAVPKAPTPPRSLEVARPRAEGDSREYPFLLYPYLSVGLSDGRGANQSWLQELPDPMTTASWDTWVEINPATAKALGLQNDDLVKIKSPASEIIAIVYVYPGIRPDVVAIPLGQGHLAMGRFANGRGANVLAMLAASVTEGGEWAWGATRVRLEKTGRRRVLPRIENNVGVDWANEEKHIPG